MTGTSLVNLDPNNPDTATGTQPLCFIEHSKHDMRIGYYNDTYVRTDDGWRLKTRAMTFIRRSGDHDSRSATRDREARGGMTVPSTAEFRSQLVAWLDENDLTPPADDIRCRDTCASSPGCSGRSTTPAGVATAGPSTAGGLGGPAILRAIVGEEVVGRRLAEPGPYSMLEVLAPTMIDYAPAELAAEMVPRLLSGEEQWCQGFSEPGSGSDLASLTTRAVQRGDEWIVNGQKVWTSFAQYSHRCILLTRTGDADTPNHEAITAFFVDLDTPGITVRPLRTMHDVDEFCEVYFDDVVVDASRMLGKPGDGWRLAMDLLPYERSTCFWQRIAYLYSRFDALIGEVGKIGGSASPLTRIWVKRIWPCTRCAAGRGRPSTGWPTVTSWARTPRSTRCCWPAPNSGSTTPHAICCRAPSNSTTPTGAPSTCTRGRPPSTAAPPKCSATSSPAACWTSGRSDVDDQIRPDPNHSSCSKTDCARPCCRPPAPSWTRRWPTWAGPTCCPTCPSWRYRWCSGCWAKQVRTPRFSNDVLLENRGVRTCFAQQPKHQRYRQI